MAMFSQLGNYKNTGLLIMRAGIGAMMVMHGLPKITHPEKWEGLGAAMHALHIYFWPTFWGFMCALTETIGGLFTMLGLWFRLVSIMMVFLFIIAVMHHLNAGDGVSGASEAIELGFAYFGLIFLGPGRYSIDKG